MEMSSKTRKHTPCSKVINKGIAYGSVVNFDVKTPTKPMNVKQTNQFIKQIKHIIEDDVRHHQNTHHRVSQLLTAQTGNLHAVWMIAHSKHFYTTLSDNLHLHGMTPVEAFDCAFDEVTDQWDPLFPMNDPEWQAHIRTTCRAFRNRIGRHVERYMLKQALQHKKAPVVLVVNQFKVEHLYDLKHVVKGILAKREGNDSFLDFTVLKAYELPMMVCEHDHEEGVSMIMDADQGIVISNPTTQDKKVYTARLTETHLAENPTYDREQRQLKVYAPIVDQRHLMAISTSPKYDGVAPYASEFNYVTKGMTPSVKELTQTYTDMVKAMKGKTCIIRIPDFRPDKPTPYLGSGLYTDIQSFCEHVDLYNDFLTAVANASRHGQVKIVVPMIRQHEEVGFWRSMVQGAFECAGVAAPPLGIMMETESAIQYHEDYEDVDFVIIGLDDFIEEVDDDYNRYDVVPKQVFFTRYGRDIRDLHQHLRLRNIEHYIQGNILSQPEILDRILKMGFRHICIPAGKMKTVEPVIQQFVENKGRYVGVAAQRLERKQEAEETKDMSHQPLKQDLLNKLEKHKQNRSSHHAIRETHKARQHKITKNASKRTPD